MHRPLSMATLFVLLLTAATAAAQTPAPAPPAVAASALTAGTEPQVEDGWVKADDGASLFYQKAGSGSPVVIVPGHLFLWNDLRPLADRFTIIAYDLRDRGRSTAVKEAARLTIQDDVRDLEAVRRQLGVERFVPVGFSYLGLMVALYALDHPERVERMVQIGPLQRQAGAQFPSGLSHGLDDIPGIQKRVDDLKALRDAGFDRRSPREFCEEDWAFLRQVLVGDPARADRLTSPCDFSNEWPVDLGEHFQALFASIGKLELPPERVAKITAPVLVIHGTHDRNVPYGSGRDWALHLPGARLLTIPGAAHAVATERSEVVLPAIRRFLLGGWPAEAEKVTALAPAKKAGP